MKFLFIADYFVKDIKGGAEFCNQVLIDELKRNNHEVILIHSHLVTDSLLNSLPDFKLIIANFINLNPSILGHICEHKDYVIYEHDHKYVRSRDPSIYKDYLAPSDQIINQKLYNNAKTVIAQSTLHRDVIQKNLPRANVKAAGISLWSDDQLNHLMAQSFSSAARGGYGVLGTGAANKGRAVAVRHCNSRQEKYVELGGEWEEMMNQMAHIDTFVFFPQTLETMSRVVVEARMLGTKLVCGQNIGAVREEWFGLKGPELIEYHRTAKEKFVKNFSTYFEKEEKGLDKGDITAILTLYRRPQNLEEQIRALYDQTIPPKEIWIWRNEAQNVDDFDVDYFLDTNLLDIPREEKFKIKCFNCNHNFKFYGRYAAALLADTKYVAIHDDDSIPGRKWFENCLDTMNKSPGILGTAGIILNGSAYNPHERCGWPKPNAEVTQVDLVGHSSFFDRSWLSHLWREKPPTWDNAEDIQFSYAAQKYGGINTFVPPHPLDDKEMWGSVKGNELGIDAVATSNNSVVSHKQFFSERDNVVSDSINKGWKLVKDIK